MNMTCVNFLWGEPAAGWLSVGSKERNRDVCSSSVVVALGLAVALAGQDRRRMPTLAANRDRGAGGYVDNETGNTEAVNTHWCRLSLVG